MAARLFPLLGLGLVAVLAGCGKVPVVSTPLPQRAYLWQREWTPAVSAAIREGAPRLDGLVVLGADIAWKDGRAWVLRPELDWAALRATATPLGIAVRLDPSAAAEADRTSLLVDTVKDLVAGAAQNGITCAELQVDYDCPDRKLAQYRRWLRAVRAALGPVRLAITALPAWLDEREFAGLAAEVDGYVLQVHSVTTRTRGEPVALCDPVRAQRWVAQAARLGRPFVVSLPTYTALVGYDPAGKSLGMALDGVQPSWPAGDSYGWEARSELKQGHDEAAAKLYLTQLALGDDSAIVSLKAVIPDRPSLEGLLNYDEAPPENATEAQLAAWEKTQTAKTQQRLESAARSALLRRLVTAHVLATETQFEMWSYGADEPGAAPAPRERCLRWLATLEKAGLKQVDDAEHLGWVAYTAGRYAEAARWQKLAAAESATGLWLRAKLLRREGKLNDAAEAMAKVFKLIRAEDETFGDTEFSSGTATFKPQQSAAGDLAGLQLTRGEFVSALDIFLQGNLWEDAAFVGDRVLTADELKKYVDEHLPEVTDQPDANNTRVRWMLARRLVREDRYADARAYFPKEQRPVLDRYVAALKDGDEARLPKMKRARAIFNAAWIARYDGMELMGCEVEPDGFVSGGSFPPGDLDVERGEGVQLVTEFNEAKQQEVVKRKPVKLLISASAEEKQRIAQTRPQPSKRFHYRYVAAGLAWKAAGLLPDGTEELADVLNNGGSWVKDRDEKLADKYFQAIEHRCKGTKIRKAAVAKHWFVDDAGPWSADLSPEPSAAPR